MAQRRYIVCVLCDTDGTSSSHDRAGQIKGTAGEGTDCNRFSIIYLFILNTVTFMRQDNDFITI